MAAKTDTITIEPLKRGFLTLRVIGDTPLYYNAMAAKAKRDLLIGGRRKTAAERALIKHNPEQEFRDSVYRDPGDGPTLLALPATVFKAAAATAALEIPGVTKTGVKRLLFLPKEIVPVWGRPLLKMDVVRSADMNRTPDIRTRAFLPRWCAEFDIAYLDGKLSAHSVVNLFAAAGVVSGIGDFRQEKGAGAYGTFRIATEDDDAEWAEITAEGRDVQADALDAAEPADGPTADLMDMLHAERNLRLVS